jgi:hypothetical protein
MRTRVLPRLLPCLLSCAALPPLPWSLVAILASPVAPFLVRGIRSSPVSNQPLAADLTVSTGPSDYPESGASPIHYLPSSASRLSLPSASSLTAPTPHLATLPYSPCSLLARLTGGHCTTPELALGFLKLLGIHISNTRPRCSG